MSANEKWPIIMFCPRCADDNFFDGSRARVLFLDHAGAPIPAAYCSDHRGERLWAIRCSNLISFTAVKP